jgi:hypothetical protein
MITSEEHEIHLARTSKLESEANKKYKLERCPFCAGVAKIFIFYSDHMMQDSIHIECKKCWARSHYRNFIEARAEDIHDKASRVYSLSVKDPKCSEALKWVLDRWNCRREFKPKKKKVSS